MIPDTKQKILDTAEKLFGEKGYDATSLRQIIAEAGVNLAAVHYHFGSKEELLDELVLRRVAPVNTARIVLLDRLDADTSCPQPAIEKVLEAFMLPMVEVATQNPRFVRLMGRLYAEGMMPAISRKHFHGTAFRFLGSMRRALPELPEGELAWRVHFMIGAMAHTMCGVPVFPEVPAAAADFPARIRRLVAFLSAGFRAPVPRFEEKQFEEKR
jgi:AcrR family transcriptional regulator